MNLKGSVLNSVSYISISLWFAQINMISSKCQGISVKLSEFMMWHFGVPSRLWFKELNWVELPRNLWLEQFNFRPELEFGPKSKFRPKLELELSELMWGFLFHINNWGVQSYFFNIIITGHKDLFYLGLEAKFALRMN